VFRIICYTVCIVIFQAAVQHVTPQHTQHLPSESQNSQPSIPTVTISDDFIEMTASTSNKTHRILTIVIEQNGHMITTININDEATIGNCFT